MNKRQQWYEGEKLVLQNYLDRWYTHVMSNFTIRGWELDLIVENTDTTVFIEVKVVDHIDDLFGYLTQKKIYFLYKTIEWYRLKHSIRDIIRLDVVFVKNAQILEIYENIQIT